MGRFAYQIGRRKFFAFKRAPLAGRYLPGTPNFQWKFGFVNPDFVLSKSGFKTPVNTDPQEGPRKEMQKIYMEARKFLPHLEWML